MGHCTEARQSFGRGHLAGSQHDLGCACEAPQTVEVPGFPPGPISWQVNWGPNSQNVKMKRDARSAEAGTRWALPAACIRPPALGARPEPGLRRLYGSERPQLLPPTPPRTAASPKVTEGHREGDLERDWGASRVPVGEPGRPRAAQAGRARAARAGTSRPARPPPPRPPQRLRLPEARPGAPASFSNFSAGPPGGPAPAGDVTMVQRDGQWAAAGAGSAGQWRRRTVPRSCPAGAALRRPPPAARPPPAGPAPPP